MNEFAYVSIRMNVFVCRYIWVCLYFNTHECVCVSIHISVFVCQYTWVILTKIVPCPVRNTGIIDVIKLHRSCDLYIFCNRYELFWLKTGERHLIKEIFFLRVSCVMKNCYGRDMSCYGRDIIIKWNNNSIFNNIDQNAIDLNYDLIVPLYITKEEHLNKVFVSLKKIVSLLRTGQNEGAIHMKLHNL